MSKGAKQGEQVRFSASVTSTAALSGTALVMSDQNGLTRTLQSYERLLLDDINADCPANTSVDIVDPGGSVVNPLLASLTSATGLAIFEGEGLSVSAGSVPTISVSAAGTFKVTGTGRVINAGTQGMRPNWQCSLIGRGL
jgi:hypothetical protein